jgi:hypothetical protein
MTVACPRGSQVQARPGASDKKPVAPRHTPTQTQLADWMTTQAGKGPGSLRFQLLVPLKAPGRGSLPAVY